MALETKFALGQVISTRGALNAFAEADEAPEVYLVRHMVGDWGQLPEEDKEANERAIEEGGRILSSYILPTGVKVWIITEANRSSTCISVPRG